MANKVRRGLTPIAGIVLLLAAFMLWAAIRLPVSESAAIMAGMTSRSDVSSDKDASPVGVSPAKAGEGRAQGVGAAALDREPAVADAEGESPRVKVRVIEARSRLPIPDAVVEMAAAPAAGTRIPVGPLRTDADGVAMVPSLPLVLDRPVLTARYGPMYGELWHNQIDGSGGMHIVALVDDPPVLVRILDASGLPLPQVEASLTIKSWPKTAPFLVSQRVIHARSNSEGVARFEHVRTHPRRSGLLPRLGGSVVAGIPGVGVKSAEFPLDQCPQTVNLMVASACAVRVRIATRLTKLPGDAAIILTAKHVSVPGENGNPGGIEAPETVRRVLDDRVAMFRCLEPGALYTATLRSAGMDIRRWDLKAPSMLGVTVDRDLRLDGWAGVSARIMAKHSRPLAGSSVTARLRAPDGREVLVPCRADSHGVAIGMVNVESVGAWSITWRGTDVWPSMIAGMVSDERQVELAPDTIAELGDVTLRDTPWLARCTVVNQEGHPVEFVRITALESEGARKALNYVFRPTSAFGSANMFDIYGSPQMDRFIVRVDGVGWSEQVVCQRGVDDCRIEHTEAGEVVAHIEGRSAKDLLVCLLRHKTGDLIPTLDVQDDGGGAFFRWHGLAPGLYDLQVRALGGESLLAEVTGLNVAAGAVSDPRLENIALLAPVQTLTMMLKRPYEGSVKPPLEGYVMVRSCGKSTKWEAVPVFLDAPSLSVTVHSLPVDVRVRIDGYATFERLQANGDFVANLDPQEEVLVILDYEGSPDYSPGTQEFRLRARRRPTDCRVVMAYADGMNQSGLSLDGHCRWHELQEMPGRGKAQAVLGLPGPGEYQLELQQRVGRSEFRTVRRFGPRTLRTQEFSRDKPFVFRVWP